MAQGWRGFGKERHSALKAGLAVLALVGFAGGWLGFANAQPPVAEVPEATATPPMPTSAIPPGRTSVPATGATATPSIATNPTEPLPTYPRPKRSRGS